MRKLFSHIIMAMIFSGMVGGISALAADIITYPLGTKLLFREMGVPVGILYDTPLKAALPSRFDWGPTANNPFKRDITGKVRDQGNCGSCWAFGSVAVLESWTNAKYNQSNVDLSEELLIRCSGAGNCQDGGYLDQAADWLVKIGTTTEACWPYTASDGPCAGWCPTTPKLAKTLSWHYASGDPFTIDINAIKQALVEHGPLAAAFEVYSDFYGYSGGVYRHTTGTYEGGHAILITGYVDNPSIPGGGYLIAKNSWGASWGPYDGYFAVAYNSNCHFGIEAIYFDNVEVYDF